MNILLAKRLTSLFLSLTLIITSTNYTSPQVSANNKKSKNEITVVKELVGERTENSNTYLLSDGSKRKDIFIDNIRYREGNTLVDYDNELVAPTSRDKKIIKDGSDDYDYVNKSSDSKVFLPSELDSEKGALVCYGKYSLSMTPILQDAEEQNNSSDIKYSSKVKEDSITYKSSDSSIKYQYNVLNNGLKESIILSNKPESNEFEFQIDATNLYLKQRKNDRGVLVCDKKTDKVIGNLEAPFLIDANGKYDYESVNYILNEEDGSKSITVSIDADYLDDENVAYPVTIDPSLLWHNTLITAQMVWSVSFMADTNMTHSTALTAMNHMFNAYPYNTEERVYLDTTNLMTGISTLGSGTYISEKCIESAELTLYEYSYNAPYRPGTMRLKEATGPWNPSTITWNNQPGVSNDVIASETFVGTEGEEHTLDITSWVKSIAGGSSANNGLVFTCDLGGAALFYGPEYNYIVENGVIVGQKHMNIRVYYRDWEDYDATVEMDASYNETEDKIDVSIEDTNELEEGVSITGYKIFARKDNSSKFKYMVEGEDISDGGSVDVSDVTNCVDLRAAILYSDGTAKVSNIITFEKHDKETEEPTTIPETESSTVETTTAVETTIDPNAPTEAPTEAPVNRTYTFDITTKDTDGDGLEDGYEIWDFKTYWNTETSNSTPENPEYVQDSDEDGLPDGYEVYYQGTNPSNEDSFDTSNDDSDNDGYTELEEYQHNTNPYLADSDFDNVGDVSDSTPRKTNTHTYSKNDSEAPIHIGMYDKQVTETEDGVSYTKVLNIYSGTIKYLYSNYGDTSLNKKLKYFYDYKGNNTAIMETYDTNSSQDIVITYTYDNNGNNTFICDQSTRYDMTYDSEKRMTAFSVGGNNLLSNNYVNVTDNSSDEDYESLNIGDVVTRDENTETYSNNSSAAPQKIKTVTITYKVNNDTQIATRTELIYNNDTSPTYVTNLNRDGKILSIYDYSNDPTDPVVYSYTYSGNNQTMTRSDGFIKQLSEVEDATNNKVTKTTTFTFKDIKNQTTNYSTSVETPKEVGENQSSSSKTTLYNNDYYNYSISADEKVATGTLKSDYYNDETIMTSTSTEVNSTNSTYAVDIYGTGDKTYDYTYDLAGNITEIKKNNTVVYRYNYDLHGRLTREKDYSRGKWIDFSYNETGNMQGKAIYDMDSNGDKITSSRVNKLYGYTNSSWPDQMTSYDGDSITYDSVGNPLSYRDGMDFEWKRGRVLGKITLSNNSECTYDYNQDNLRTYKDTSDETVYYEWDDTKLLKELVYDKSECKYYDIWYYYDSENNMLGFEYSYVNSAGNKETVKMYYEKNLQGDVMALLDDRGRERVTYSYNAWGNVLSHSIDTGWNKAYELNHITYRSYYQDSETGFYYLQSRYYDSEVGRFVNADDVDNIMRDELGIYKDNLYIYCNGNPINNIDPTGEWAERYKGFLITKRGFDVDYNAAFLSKSFCLKYAKNVAKRYGGKILFIYYYRNMTVHRIAVEMYAHAVFYAIGNRLISFSKCIKPIKKLLKKLGVPKRIISTIKNMNKLIRVLARYVGNKLIRHTKEINVNYNESISRLVVYYSIWNVF